MSCVLVVQAVVQLPKVPRKMFSSQYIKKLLEGGSEESVKSVYTELEAQVRTVDHHISLIDQLEEIELGMCSPLNQAVINIADSFCHSKQSTQPESMLTMTAIVILSKSIQKTTSPLFSIGILFLVRILSMPCCRVQKELWIIMNADPCQWNLQASILNDKVKQVIDSDGTQGFVVPRYNNKVMLQRTKIQPSTASLLLRS